jgi:hypothetical protein
MMSFVRRNFADDILDAWLDFNQDDSPIPLQDDFEEGQIFMPYFLFDWDPQASPRRRGGMGQVAQSYGLMMGSRLPELESLILEQATTQPLSFYELIRSFPSRHQRNPAVAQTNSQSSGIDEVPTISNTANLLGLEQSVGL